MLYSTRDICSAVPIRYVCFDPDSKDGRSTRLARQHKPCCKWRAFSPPLLAYSLWQLLRRPRYLWVYFRVCLRRGLGYQAQVDSIHIYIYTYYWYYMVLTLARSLARRLALFNRFLGLVDPGILGI